jgi:hypothetical protein
VVLHIFKILLPILMPCTKGFTPHRMALWPEVRTAHLGGEDRGGEAEDVGVVILRLIACNNQGRQQPGMGRRAAVHGRQ